MRDSFKKMQSRISRHVAVYSKIIRLDNTETTMSLMFYSVNKKTKLSEILDDLPYKDIHKEKIQCKTTTPSWDDDMWEMMGSDTFRDKRIVWEPQNDTKESRIYILIKIVQ